MLFHAKVYKFIIRYDSVIIRVISEHVFYEIVNLPFLFEQDVDEEITNLSLLKLHVSIFIELDDFFIKDFSDSKCQLIGLEVKFVLLCSLAL